MKNEQHYHRHIERASEFSAKANANAARSEGTLYAADCLLSRHKRKGTESTVAPYAAGMTEAATRSLEDARDQYLKAAAEIESAIAKIKEDYCDDLGGDA
tara:strand:- start:1391 stop:1690 length:300 start_codon:yes stop_codon:yes gene_type:complete